ncbi:hypothetical protein E4U42_005449, partial [Claviceps africana]
MSIALAVFSTVAVDSILSVRAGDVHSLVLPNCRICLNPPSLPPGQSTLHID